MSKTWVYKSLDSVAKQISDGSHNPPSGIEHSDYPMLSSKNIGFDSFNYDEPRYLTKEQFDAEDKRTNVSDGDVLLTIVGTIGRACCITAPFKPFTLQRSVAVIKPNREEIISRYLMYCLTAMNSVFNKEAKGVAQKGIYLKQLGKIKVPVPPIMEQEQIVAELDLLSGLIDKQKAQLKELDTLAQSIFYDMFGDPEEKNGQWTYSTLLGISIGKLTYGSGASAIDYDGMHRYIRITDVDDNGTLRGVPVSPSVFDNKYLLREGDVLFARTGATVGKTYLHRDIYGKCIYAGYLIRLVPNRELVLPEYVFGFTKTSYYKSFVDSAQKAVAQPNINAEQYGNLSIPVPTLSLQRLYTEKIEAIEKQKASINESIVQTQKLFDYTMDKYFG